MATQRMLTKGFISRFFSCCFYVLVTNLSIPGRGVTLGKENNGRERSGNPLEVQGGGEKLGRQGFWTRWVPGSTGQGAAVGVGVPRPCFLCAFEVFWPDPAWGERGRKEGPMRVPSCGLRSKLLVEPGQQLLCLWTG